MRPSTRWLDVFADREYASMWLAHVLSLAGDQLARVALTALIYERTRSGFAASAAYAVTLIPWLLGGPLLSGLGDRFPRRAVMIGCDLGSAVLVALMAVPGVPLAVLCGLLFAATLLAPPFAASRSALVRDLFPDDDRYGRATAVTQVTIQGSHAAGFAAGGLLAAALGPRPALLADAATFLLSAAVVRLGVAARPAAAGAQRPSFLAGIRAGARTVFGIPRLRAIVLLTWLAALHIAPAGVVAPYAAARGGGPAAIGLLLASIAVGTAAGLIAVGRLAEAARLRLMYPLAIAAGIPMIACAARPGLLVSALLWAAGGMLTSYLLATNVAFVAAVPAAGRAQAVGIVTAGLAAGQGLGVIAAGALADYLTPETAIAAAGATATLLAAALYTRDPERNPRPGRYGAAQ
jgi:predicted MFS family arabinose efflux permease